MKKTLFISILILLFLLVGCKSSNSHLSNANSSTSESSGSSQADPLPNESIGVRNLEALNEMREMIECTDEEKLNQYLRSVEGGGAHSREDLIGFVSIIDSLPLAKLIEGDIVWLSYSHGQSQDTGENYDIVYVTMQAPSGDWVRIEYDLSVTTITDKIEAEALELSSSSVLLKPIQNEAGNVTIFSETREIHPSGTGKLIQWIANIDGIYANVIYYTKNADAVVATDLYRSLTLSRITDQ